MRKLGFVLAFLWVATFAQGQSCPVDDESFGYASEESTLHGTLLNHDELRQWLGLKLDRSVCGESEIQLVFVPDGLKKAETLQGCSVEVTGKLYLSPTGYYSAHLAVQDPRLNPDPSCHPLPLKPDLSSSPVPKDLQTYSVSITVDYRGRGHVQVAVRQFETKAILKPWQAYATYMLNGSADLLWFGCRRGFRLGHVTQRPPALSPPMTDGSDDEVGTGLDPDSINTIMFSCHKGSIASK
jgi:hypothetical protein